MESATEGAVDTNKPKMEGKTGVGAGKVMTV